MNKTRREWSGVYQCCKDKQHSLTAFFSLAASIIMISISFYCTLYYFGSKQSSNETLSDRDIGRHVHEQTTLAAPSASTSGATSSRQLLINRDDSDDDMLTGSENAMAPKKQDLITLNN